MTKTLLTQCEHAPYTGMHVWMCYQHDWGWRKLRVFCFRCARRCLCTSAELQAYQAEADSAEEERLKRLNEQPQRIYKER